MPIRIGEFTTVSTSNFYFYPPLGASSIAQGYILATGPTGFMVPQNPNALASTIVGGGYLDSTISTTISSTNACLAQTSTLTTYVSINTASISSLTSQVSTLSSGLLGLSNYVVAVVGATPGLSTQVSSLTAGYSTLVYGYSSLSTTVSSQGITLSNVSTGLALTATNLSSLTQNFSSLSSTVSSLGVGLSSLSSFVSGQAVKLQSVSNSLSTTIENVSSLSTIVSSQGGMLVQVGASLCTTVETVSSLSSIVAGLSAGSVTAGQFTDLSTYTSYLGVSVGTLFLNFGAIDLRVSSLSQSISTISTQVSSLQSTTSYILNNSLTNVGVLGLLSSQNNVWFGSNIQVSSISSNIYFRNGRIGIGTNTPSSNLTINENTLILGDSEFKGTNNFGGAANFTSNVVINKGVSTLFAANTASYTVTIGSAAAIGYRLNVIGNTSLQGNLYTYQESYFYSTVNVYSGDFAVNTDTLYVDSGVSRVGVGCNAPAYTLDVAGTTHTSTLMVDSAISTNYIVQRTPLIWSYEVTGTITAGLSGYANIVAYNKSNYEPTGITTPLSNLAAGKAFNVPYSGLYNIKLSYQSFNSNTGNPIVTYNQAQMCSSNLSGGPLNVLNYVRTSDSNNIGTQIPVSMEYYSTFTTGNSIFIYLLLIAGTNEADNFNFTVQYLG
jgi:hypothetical protein